MWNEHHGSYYLNYVTGFGNSLLQLNKVKLVCSMKKFLLNISLNYLQDCKCACTNWSFVIFICSSLNVCFAINLHPKLQWLMI